MKRFSKPDEGPRVELLTGPGTAHQDTTLGQARATVSEGAEGVNGAREAGNEREAGLSAA